MDDGLKTLVRLGGKRLLLPRWFAVGERGYISRWFAEVMGEVWEYADGFQEMALKRCLLTLEGETLWEGVHDFEIKIVVVVLFGLILMGASVWFEEG